MLRIAKNKSDMHQPNKGILRESIRRSRLAQRQPGRFILQRCMSDVFFIYSGRLQAGSILKILCRRDHVIVSGCAVSDRCSSDLPNSSCHQVLQAVSYALHSQFKLTAVDRSAAALKSRLGIWSFPACPLVRDLGDTKAAVPKRSL